MALFDRLRSGVEVRTLVLAAVVGLFGGLGGVGFRALVALVQTATVGGENMLVAAQALTWWQRLILPTAGAAAASILLYWIGRERETAGVSGLMEIVGTRGRRRPSVRVTMLRALASVGILSTGGSVGREGPIIQIAASIGGSVGERARVDRQRLGLLLGCGVAAGMAAAYNAPVAGALFAMELVLANFAIDIFAPVVVASVVATTVSRLLVGAAPVYVIPHAPASGNLLIEIGTFLLLGILCGALAVAFMESLTRATRAFRAIKLPLWARTTLGGLLVGCIGIWLPHVWGNGYEVVDLILHEDLALSLVAVLLLFKILATSITVGSGGPGGVFTPSLFVGATLGLLYGHLAASVFPGLTSPPVTYAIVGMAGLIAGTTQAPFMAIFVLVEMTNDFAVVVPLMLGTIASAATAYRIRGESLYTATLRERGVRLPMGLEETALSTTKVGDLLRRNVATLSIREPLEDVLSALVATRHDALFVVDDDGNLMGAVRLHDVKELLAESEIGPLLIAADLFVPIPSVQPGDALVDVLEHFDDPELDEVPVTEPDSRRLLGYLSRRDVIAMLSLEVVGGRSRRARFVWRDRATSDYVELPSDHRLERIELPEGLAGKTIAESDFRARTGLSILLVLRTRAGSRTERIVPSAGLVLEEADALLVFGPTAQIEIVRSEAEGSETDDSDE